MKKSALQDEHIDLLQDMARIKRLAHELTGFQCQRDGCGQGAVCNSCAAKSIGQDIIEIIERRPK